MLVAQCMHGSHTDCPESCLVSRHVLGSASRLLNLEEVTYHALLQVCAVGLYADLAGSFTAALAEPALKPEQVSAECCHAACL